jgi:hypothetical protein
MKVTIEWLAKALNASEIVDHGVHSSTRGKSGKKAEAMLERFNSLSVDDRIAFLNAASDFSWFARSIIKDVGVVDVNVSKTST